MSPFCYDSATVRKKGLTTEVVSPLLVLVGGPRFELGTHGFSAPKVVVLLTLLVATFSLENKALAASPRVALGCSLSPSFCYVFATVSQNELRVATRTSYTLHRRIAVYAPYLREWGIYYVRLVDKRTGVQRIRSTGEATLSKAREEAQRLAEEFYEEVSSARRQSKMLVFGTAYREWLSLRDCEEITRRDYRSQLNGFEGVFGHLLVRDVSFGHIERYILKLSRENKAPRTQKKRLATLRNFFRWCVRMKYHVEDPTDGIRVRGREQKEPIALTPDEAGSLLKACSEKIIVEKRDTRRGKWKQSHTPPRSLLISVSLYMLAGIRDKTIRELLWRHVDLGEARLTIPAELMKAKRPHDVPMHPDLVQILREEAARLKKIDPDALVLGETIRHRIGTKAFEGAVTRAKIRTIWPHCLRHTFITWLENVAPRRHVQLLCGHAPSSVTDRYSHPTFEQLRESVAKLPRVLGRTVDPDAAQA